MHFLRLKTAELGLDFNQFDLRSWPRMNNLEFWSIFLAKARLYSLLMRKVKIKKNVNFVKNKTLKMWILWKMRFWKMWILSNITYEALKMRILWKMIFWKCEFCQIWGFEIFFKYYTVLLWILWKMRLWKWNAKII